MEPKLLSIQVGLPKTIVDQKYEDGRQAQWTTGFFKSPVAGWVDVRETNLAGDGQADTIQHGGVDKAILVYSADHFEDWSAELDGRMVTGGMFGENLTVKGLNEETVCLGDRFQLNNVILEVSQPRQPCWKLGRRWNLKTLPKLVVKSGRCGWYCRVIQTGKIQSGLRLEMIDRIHPQWSIRRAHETLYDKGPNQAARDELKAIKELSAAWKADL